MEKYSFVWRHFLPSIILLHLMVTVSWAANWLPLPDTGQTKCYSDAYSAIDPTVLGTKYDSEIPCPKEGQPFYGQDAHYVSKLPSFRSQIVNGQGIIIDNNTSLIWQQKTEDNNGDGFLTSSDLLKWEDAMGYCENLNFGGRSNWRLPTLIELESIVNYQNIPPINPIFNVLTDEDYWTSTVDFYNYNIPHAWKMSFNTGSPKSISGLYTKWVRCVSGGTTSNFGPYINNNDNTITDSGTELTWMRHPGDINNDSMLDRNDHVNWRDALAWCENATIGGNSDWRLPNIRELRSLVNNSFDEPKLDPVFLYVNRACNSSSTTSSTKIVDISGARYPPYAWGVVFSSGENYLISKQLQGCNVRCVRGGLPPPPPKPKVKVIIPTLQLLLLKK